MWSRLILHINDEDLESRIYHDRKDPIGVTRHRTKRGPLEDSERAEGKSDERAISV